MEAEWKFLWQKVLVDQMSEGEVQSRLRNVHCGEMKRGEMSVVKRIWEGKPEVQCQKVWMKISLQCKYKLNTLPPAPQTKNYLNNSKNYFNFFYATQVPVKYFLTEERKKITTLQCQSTEKHRKFTVRATISWTICNSALSDSAFTIQMEMPLHVFFCDTMMSLWVDRAMSATLSKD